MKYQTRPQVVEAIQWDGQADTVNKFVSDREGDDWKYVYGDKNDQNQQILIRNGADWLYCKKGDYIIKHLSGACFVCSEQFFKDNYARC